MAHSAPLHLHWTPESPPWKPSLHPPSLNHLMHTTHTLFNYKLLHMNYSTTAPFTHSFMGAFHAGHPLATHTHTHTPAHSLTDSHTFCPMPMMQLRTHPTTISLAHSSFICSVACMFTRLSVHFCSLSTFCSLHGRLPDTLQIAT